MKKLCTTAALVGMLVVPAVAQSKTSAADKKTIKTLQKRVAHLEASLEQVRQSSDIVYNTMYPILTRLSDLEAQNARMKVRLACFSPLPISTSSSRGPFVIDFSHADLYIAQIDPTCVGVWDTPL